MLPQLPHCKDPRERCSGADFVMQCRVRSVPLTLAEAPRTHI